MEPRAIPLARAGRRLRRDRLLRDRAGVTAVEFALVVPFLLLIMSMGVELGMAYYVDTVLNGTINAAGRASSLQSGQTGTSAIDAQVTAQIRNAVPWAQVTTSRKNYTNFTNIGTPEDFTDSNHNGQYDQGECFADANGNGVWDADMGASGIGGANDAVLYTVRVTYAPIFPFTPMLGLPSQMSLSASTIMRNQPFATQSTRTTTQIC